MSSDITIRLIRAFDGPRHQRLRDIWTAIAEYIAPHISVRWYANEKGLRHAQAFDVMWREEEEFNNQIVLFTEEDFLPDLTMGRRNWTGLSSFQDEKQAAAGVMYCTRSPKSREVLQYGDKAGGWFICIDKTKFPGPRHFSFEGTPDPANQLRPHLRDFGWTVSLLAGNDGYPHHFGMEYPYGTHLFWSRHYHDDPNIRVSGFKLGDIQWKVDWRIPQWIAEQPEEFQKLLVGRFGSGILGSCSEYIDLRHGFRESFTKFVNLAKLSAASVLSSSSTDRRRKSSRR
jgi:hypothetical protein